MPVTVGEFHPVIARRLRKGETGMVTIVGISGSLRTGSFNTALLHAAIELAPEGTEIVEGSIRDFPLYNADIEKADGIPEPVTALKEQVVTADALLLVTPEYNNGIPGVFKNAIDWMSRPPKDIVRVFGAKPVGLMGASPGAFGTTLSQVAWLPVLRTLGTDPWFGRKMLLSRAGAAFEDEDMRLTDEDVRGRLAKWLEGFAAYVVRRAAE
jgi:NAD(P)H-dependent FMN reductase